MTTELFTTTGASTWTVPAGVTSIDVELWASGAGGAANNNSSLRAGGGGGAYSKKTLSVTAGTIYNYSIPAGGAGETGSTNPIAGADAWFGGTNFATALVSAKGGGICPTANTAGPGGLASGGVGDVKFNGGSSGAGNSDGSGAGGGGGAGPDGAGVNGSNAAGGSTAVGGNGGAGDNGSGGAGGNGAGTSGSKPGANGTANVLGGGGGQGGYSNEGNGGAGAAPGGGGASAGNNVGSSLGGAGARGQMRITYTAASGSAVGAATGTSTATATSKADKRSTAAVSGTSTVQATSKALKASLAASTGIVTVLAVARADTRAVAATTGTSTVSGVGKAAGKGAGTSTGVSVVSGVGKAQARIVGSSTGSGTAQATSKADKRSTASSSGTSTVSGVARADAKMVAATSGTSTATAVGKASKKGVGNAPGTSTVSGVARADARSTGSSVGVATANAVSAAFARSIGSTGAGYAWKNTITIDHTKVSTANQTNFPVLVLSTIPDLRTVANSGNITSLVTLNGKSVPADLIFTSDSGGLTLLSWEIAAYNAATGAIEVWIKIPSLSVTVDTVIYMWYGNNTVTTYQSTATSAWNSNFKGVWHLNDNAASTAVVDSTSNVNTMTNQRNTSLATVAAKVSTGLDYNGTTDSSIKSSASNQALPITIEGWFRVDATNVFHVIFSHNTAATNNGFRVQVSGVLNCLQCTFGGIADYSFTSLTVAANTNYYFAVTISGNGGTAIGYLATAGGSITTQSLTVGTPTGTPDTLQIGALLTGLTNGWIDEVRFYNVARSAGWINTSFNNQNSPSTFYAIGTATQNSIGPSATVLGVGKALARMAGSSTSLSTVTGVMRAQARIVATASGVAVATGILRANGRMVAAGSGSSTVTGMVKGLARLTGSASGTSAASATARAQARSVGIITGSSAANGVLRTTVRAVGLALGSSTVLGTGSFRNLLPEQLDITTELTLLSERIEVTMKQNITTELRLI